MQAWHAGHGIDVFGGLQLNRQLSEQGGDRHDAGRNSRIKEGDPSCTVAGGDQGHRGFASDAPRGCIYRIDVHLLVAHDAIEFAN